MKIKNKLKYIFIYFVVSLLLLSFLSLFIFASNQYFYNANYLMYSYFRLTSSSSYNELRVVLTNVKYNNVLYDTLIILTHTQNNNNYINIYYANDIIASVSSRDLVNIYYYNDSNVSYTRTGNSSTNDSGSYLNGMTIVPPFNDSINNIVSLYGNQIGVYNHSYGFFSVATSIHRLYTINFVFDQTDSPLSKTYDVGSFYNNGSEYNQIVVNGMSSDNSTFESVADIDYRNTVNEASDTVYSSDTWNGNYNSVLNYYAGSSVPDISSLNSDLNNIITFTVNVLPVAFNNYYDVGVFLNGGNEYNRIVVNGYTINNSSFSSITDIDYRNTITGSSDTVYSGSWNGDHSSVLTYYSSGSVPDVSSINSATSSIITFTTSLYSVNISRTYYFDFYNNDQYFTSITVNGVSNDNVVLSSVTSVYYDNTLVYDGLFISPYTRMLYYYNNMTVPDVHDLNEFCNFIVYFTPTVITTVSPDIVDELLAGVNVLLLPITSFISLAENNFVIAIVLVMGLFGMVAVTVFSFIKRKNE